jgi:hypothetical protein
MTVCVAHQHCVISHVEPSGHYMYRQFNIQQFCVLPTQLYLCILCGSQNTAIVSLYNINWLIFITEMERVYCVVRNIIQVSISH